MFIGQGCKVHLVAHELPRGRIICNVSRHLCAVIDGVIHDTHDPNDRSHQEQWVQVRNGVEVPAYTGPRCVYGYWSKA
jgi:hypothetical protein